MRTNICSLFVILFCLLARGGAAQEVMTLEPGTLAPGLSVNQWVTTGGLSAKALENVEQGKIQVVEFWSTTCEGAVPCVLQMASLKQQYGSDDVRFTLISHESTETINSFLKLSTRTQDGQSVSHQQLAASFAIGSDPDRSTHKGYLGKDNVGLLPWAFLFGRNGGLEWHGHPSELDSVLEAVVQGRWDRNKIEQDQKLMAEIQESIARLSKNKDWKNAILELDRFLSLTDDPRIRFGLLKSKIEIYARSGNASKEIADVVGQLFQICREEPLFAHDVANTVYQLAIRGHLRDNASMLMSVDGLMRAVNQVEDGSTKSGMLHTLAKLEGLLGRTEQAIEHQKMAITLADEPQKPALQAFLAKLTSQASVSR